MTGKEKRQAEYRKMQEWTAERQRAMAAAVEKSRREQANQRPSCHYCGMPAKRGSHGFFGQPVCEGCGG